jgi:hypothetical protein
MAHAVPPVNVWTLHMSDSSAVARTVSLQHQPRYVTRENDRPADATHHVRTDALGNSPRSIDWSMVVPHSLYQGPRHPGSSSNVSNVARCGCTSAYAQGSVAIARDVREGCPDPNVFVCYMAARRVAYDDPRSCAFRCLYRLHNSTACIWIPVTANTVSNSFFCF